MVSRAQTSGEKLSFANNLASRQIKGGGGAPHRRCRPARRLSDENAVLRRRDRRIERAQTVIGLGRAVRAAGRFEWHGPLGLAVPLRRPPRALCGLLGLGEVT